MSSKLSPLVFRFVIAWLILLPTNSNATADDETDLLVDESTWYRCELAKMKEGKLTVHAGPCVKIGGNDLADGMVEVCLYDDVKLKSCVTLERDFNAAKASISCSGQTIKIFSQAGYSAAESSFSLIWNNKRLLPKGEQHLSDPSFDALKEGDRLLSKGRIEDAVNKYSEMMYPDRYVDEDDLSFRVIRKAHEVGLAKAKSKDFKGAVKIMRPAIDEFSTPPGEPKKKAAYIEALNDYGYFLDEAGNHIKAAEILNKVTHLDPERAVAYLNLGDALFAQKKDAANAYGAYGRLVSESKWPIRVKTRCPQCVGKK